MANIATNLEQVLQSLGQLGLEELKIVEQQIVKAKAKNGRRSNPETLLEDKRFLFSFEEYLTRSTDELQELQNFAYEKYRDWIYEEMAKRGARWMIVCGGVILDWSSKLKDYPSDEKLDDIGKRAGFAPFVFIANPIIEESHWTTIPDGDFYPSIPITVGAPNWNLQNMNENGFAVISDFDSGANNILFDYNSLQARSIITNQPTKTAQTGYHLGREYKFYFLPLQIALTDETGKITSQITKVLCVRNWQQSPLRIVNPFRKALVGRNLLLELSLRIELDGANRATKILAAA